MKDLELRNELENNAINYKNNCFDVIRLIAAFQVMIGHLIEHFELDINFPVFKFLGLISTYIPGKGVILFFLISGFFSFSSLEKIDYTVDKLGYWKKKFLRIYPELWLAFIVNTVLIIVLYGLSNNFLDNIIYFVTQTTVFQFYTGNWLREYGVGTPNGALWTITVTIQFYIVVFFLFKISKEWTIKKWIILLISSMMISIIISNLFIPEIIRKLFQVSIIPYFYIFVFGIIAYQFRDKLINLLSKWFWLFWILYLLIKFSIMNIACPIQFGVLYDVFSSIFLSAAVIGIGYSFGNIRMKYEISYSIFIWHMIICNVCLEIAELYNISLDKCGVVLFLITIIITLLLSFLSSMFGRKVIKLFENKRS